MFIAERTPEITNLPVQGTNRDLSPIEMGLEASKNGDLTTARQMFIIAIEQLTWQFEKQSDVIDLMLKVGDSYASESAFDLAKKWYNKALERASVLPKRDKLQIALIVARLAELVLPSLGISQFNKSFERLEQVSLLAQKANLDTIIGALADISWTLFIKGYHTQGQYINSLIDRIEQSSQEDKVTSLMRLSAA